MMPPSAKTIRYLTYLTAGVFGASLIAFGGFGRTVALLFAGDVLAVSVMWRVDRRVGSTRGRLVEDLGYLTVSLVIIAALFTYAPSWVAVWGSWYWYPVGGALGLALIRLSGLRVGALWSGELAFLAGPKPLAPALVNGVLMISGAVSEEALYRGIALFGGRSAVVIGSIAAAGVFVGRHHLPPWAQSRSHPRTYAVEGCSAASLLCLTVLSHSLYPALLAHLVNNVPAIALQVQRAFTE